MWTWVNSLSSLRFGFFVFPPEGLGQLSVQVAGNSNLPGCCDPWLASGRKTKWTLDENGLPQAFSNCIPCPLLWLVTSSLGGKNLWWARLHLEKTWEVKQVDLGAFSLFSFYLFFTWILLATSRLLIPYSQFCTLCNFLIRISSIIFPWCFPSSDDDALAFRNFKMDSPSILISLLWFPSCWMTNYLKELVRP